MTTVRFCCGFESGDEQQWGGPSGPADVTAAAALSGAYGLHVNPAAGGAYVGRQFPAITGAFVGRYKLRFPGALPTGTLKQMVLFCESLSSDFPGTFLTFDPSDNKLKMITYDGGGAVVATSTGPVVAADTTYRIDFHYVGVSGSQKWNWQVDGVAQTEIASAGAFIVWYFGRNTSQTYSVYYDDISLIYDASASLAPSAFYPIGDGYAKALKPISNGANSGAGSFAASVGTLADSWQFLDNRRVLATTDYVEQNVIGTGDYLQYAFEALASNETPINAVSIFMGGRSSFISANNIQVHLVEGSNDYTLYNSLWIEFGVFMVTLPGLVDVISAAKVNALLFRWGYSSDVDSIPRLGALGLEVDVRVTPPVVLGNPGSIQLEGLVLPVRWQDAERASRYRVLDHDFAQRVRPHKTGRPYDN